MVRIVLRLSNKPLSELDYNVSITKSRGMSCHMLHLHLYDCTVLENGCLYRS